jgi:NADH-quinone oxidoreductase subunit J
MGTEMVGPKAVGQALFTQYLLLVEVAAMLLLAALVAGFHIGKREPSAEEEKE